MWMMQVTSFTGQLFFWKTQKMSKYLDINREKYESPEGTWGFLKKNIYKSLYRIVQSFLTERIAIRQNKLSILLQMTNSKCIIHEITQKRFRWLGHVDDAGD